MSKRIGWPLAALAAIALAGALLLLFATTRSVGISYDSVVYFDAAHELTRDFGASLLKSKSFLRRPPLYPGVLATLSAFGPSAETAARWLNLFLFAADIFLVGAALFLLTGRSIGIALLGSILTLTAGAMWAVHVMAWSEPLFILLGFGGLTLLALHLEKPKARFLILSALLIGFAFLTRYAAPPLIGASLIGLLAWSDKRFWRRVPDAAIFAAISCAPVAFWMLRNLFAFKTLTGRTPEYHPIGYNMIQMGAGTLSRWIIPQSICAPSPPIVLAIAAAIIFFLAVLAYRKSRMEADTVASGSAVVEAPPLRCLPALFALFLAIYIPFLIVSISFVDPGTPLDDRILSPVFMPLLVLVLWLAHVALRRAKDDYDRPVRIALICLAVVICVACAINAKERIADFRANGFGLDSPKWQHSETIASVKKLPAQLSVITNEQDAVHYFTGRATTPIPDKRLWTREGDLAPNLKYQPTIEWMQRTINEGRNLVVYFFDPTASVRQPTEDELVSDMGLQPISRGNDGVIYGLAKPLPKPTPRAD